MKNIYLPINLLSVATLFASTASSFPTSCWVGYGSAVEKHPVPVDPIENYVCACYKFSCDGQIVDVSACSESEKSAGSEMWAYGPQTTTLAEIMLGEPDIYIEMNTCIGLENCNAPTNIYCGGQGGEGDDWGDDSSANSGSAIAASVLVSTTLLVSATIVSLV